MFIGERIRELRLEKDLLQRELAAKIHVAANTLCQFESGKANPSYEVLLSLADFFEVSTDYLLGREDDFGNVTVKSDSSAPSLSPDEARLLETFRKLNVKNRIHVSTYAEIRLEEQDEDGSSAFRIK